MCSMEDVAAGSERSTHALLAIQLLKMEDGCEGCTHLRRIERKQLETLFRGRELLCRSSFSNLYPPF